MPINIETMKPNDRYLDESGREFRVTGFWSMPVVMMEPVEGARLRDDRVIGGVGGLMWDRYKKIDRLVIDDPLHKPEVAEDIRAGDAVRIDPNGYVNIIRSAKPKPVAVVSTVHPDDTRHAKPVYRIGDEIEVRVKIRAVDKDGSGVAVPGQWVNPEQILRHIPAVRPIEANAPVQIEGGQRGVVIGMDGDEVWVRYDEPDSLGLKRGIYTRDQLTRAD